VPVGMNKPGRCRAWWWWGGCLRIAPIYAGRFVFDRQAHAPQQQLHPVDGTGVERARCRLRDFQEAQGEAALVQGVRRARLDRRVCGGGHSSNSCCCSLSLRRRLVRIAHQPARQIAGVDHLGLRVAAVPLCPGHDDPGAGCGSVRLLMVPLRARREPDMIVAVSTAAFRSSSWPSTDRTNGLRGV